MKDACLYQQFRGDTSSWHVAAVRLDAAALAVEIEMAMNGDELRGWPGTSSIFGVIILGLCFWCVAATLFMPT